MKVARKSRRGHLAIVAAVTAVAGFASSSHATTQYWDGNDGVAGAGAAPSGTWGTSNFWTTDSTGATAGTTGWLVTTDDAVFSASNDAVGPFTVTLSGTQTANSVLVEEGTFNLAQIAGDGQVST